jgi:hypothetical protein
MKKRKKLDFVQFKIRLRESLRKQLEVAAHAKDVSLNSEMVSRLERSFIQDSLDNQIAVMGRVVKVMDRMAGMLDREYTDLERTTALADEMKKTEDGLRKMEDVAWGKPTDEVPDREETEATLRAALKRVPTDEELRAAARIRQLPRPRVPRRESSK